MSAHVIRLHGRRFVGINPPPEPDQKGWRPLRWVADPQVAEIFSTDANARAFADTHLGHENFEIVALAPRRPGNFPTGGTPVAMTG